MSADRNAPARSVAVEPGRTRLDTLLLLALVGGLVLLALKCAWVCDDAYISFRVVDNFVEGYGLRWNTVERVQAYTNPLWMGLVTLPYALTREPYYTSLALSLACTALVGLGFALKVTRDIAGAALALTVLCGSKAFVDFSTSGLENPLLHLALLGALATWTSPEPDRNRSLKLGLWSSAVAMTRLDALALLVPVLVAHLWHERSMRAWRQLALGFAPLFAWEIFSLAYYGAWIPNSAISKLSSGLPQSELSAQGVSYLANSLALDPLTLLAIAAACAVAVWKRERTLLAATLGILLHLFYVTRVGGDFMSGRFLTAPLLMAAWVLATARLDVRACAVGALGVLVLIGFTPRSPLRAPIDYAQGKRSPEFIAATGIADERGYWYAVAGLFSPNLTSDGKLHVQKGHPLAAQFRERGTRVSLAEGIGYLGYWSGPNVHLVDPMGLSDALLARMPIYVDGKFVEAEKNAANATRGWRVGHYYRAVPKGYLDSLGDPTIALEEPELEKLRRELDLLTRAPLFDVERWRAIARRAL